MDINNLLVNLNNVDEYISRTQEISNQYKNAKVLFNITTVLGLKKIRSLEIEFLNKCHENGVATIIFERLLTLPPSKTWGVLGKELVELLQYWLEAIRKHMINHHLLWWSFLKLLLKFINVIRQKDSSMPNLLVEHTAECLFDLATRDSPDAYQRHEILHCMNLFFAESRREIRFAMRTKFGDYFIKLASIMARTGYFPYQFSAIEALVRWLLPRHDRSLRLAAADKWFPRDLFPDSAKEVFVNADWNHFLQESRNFLNALNNANGLVTSVICRRLSVGHAVLVTGVEKRQSWLDINSSGRCISILLDIQGFGGIGASGRSGFEVMVIAEDNTQNASLLQGSQELTLTLQTHRPPRVCPSDVSVGEDNHVSIVVSTRADLRTLNAALANVFGHKYHLVMDLDADVSLSPPRTRPANKVGNSSEEDTRFSNPVEVTRRKQAGYKVSSKIGSGFATPSTASTSSLAQLRDKLTDLPRFRYDNEPVSICAQPQLSCVTEISEAEVRSINSMSTLKYRPHLGVTVRREKKGGSDSETLKPKVVRHILPGNFHTSCLLGATIGSADDSVINDTVERLSKSKEYKHDNIVDLLIQEALQAKLADKGKISDSGIEDNRNSQVGEENDEVIDNTPDNVKKANKKQVTQKKNCTVISKSTTDDESNTEAINETPVYVNSRKKLIRDQLQKAVKPTFDVQAVDQFFSQHVVAYKHADIVISPTLARKINKTSSESSENFGDTLLNMNENSNVSAVQSEFSDTDIIECIHDMVDKVCSETDRRNILDNIQTPHMSNNEPVVVLEDITNIVNPTVETKSKPKRNVKLNKKSTVVKKEKGKPRVTSKKINKNTEIKTKKMSTIIEQTDEEIVQVNVSKANNEKTARLNSPDIREIPGYKQKDTPEKANTETPFIKKKRKLYSPKDDDINKERKEPTVMHEDDIALSEFKTINRNKSITTTATSYKEIEKDRQKNIRLPRSRKSRSKVQEKSPSPKTTKINIMFDKLKETVENEGIILADKTSCEIYNYPSESEDEDFEKKKIEVQKRQSNTTLSSFESAISKIRGRQRTRALYSEKSSYDEDRKPKVVKRKKPVKRSNKLKVNADIEPVVGLVDERMRKAGPEILNTSIIIEKGKPTEVSEVELVLQEPPQMELITENQEHSRTIAPQRKKVTKKDKTAKILSIKKEKGLSRKDELKVASEKDEGTISPLPGLVVESLPMHQKDANDSVTSVTLQKLKKICNEGTLNESNNTQNMLLSDLERCNIPQNVADTTYETIFVDHYDNIERNSVKGKICKNNIKKRAKIFKEPTENTIMKDVSEVVDISEQVIQSEMSISTGSITAHGDFNEAPPSPEMIDVSMQPREIEDFEQSMRDHFTELTREAHSPRSNASCKSAERTEVSNILRKEIDKTYRKTRSPILAIKTLDLDDNISKWLPSRRTSETNSSTKTSPQAKTNPQVKAKYIETQDEMENADSTFQNTQEETLIAKHRSPKELPPVSLKQLSPTVSIARMSMEEFENWLPLPKSPQQDEKKINQISSFRGDFTKTSPQVTTNPQVQGKDFKTRGEINKSDSEFKKTHKESIEPMHSSPKELSRVSPKQLSPTVSIARISMREFEKWLPMPRSLLQDKKKVNEVSSLPIKDSQGSFKLVYRNGSKSKDKIKETTPVSSSIVTEGNKKHIRSKKEAHTPSNLESMHDNDYSNIESGRDKDKSESKYKYCLRLKTNKNTDQTSVRVRSKSNYNLRDNIKTNEVVTNEKERVSDDNDARQLKEKSTKMQTNNEIGNKTLISPIRGFEVFLANYQNNDKKSVDDDECTRGMFNRQSKAKKDIEKDKKNETSVNYHQNVEPQIESPNSNSTNLNDSVKSLKRKSSTPMITEPKKRRIDMDIVSLSESVPTASQNIQEVKKSSVDMNTGTITISDRGQSFDRSNVSDWLQKNESSRRTAEDTTRVFEDLLQNILEKIDTTQKEINESTSKKFAMLSVKLHGELRSNMEEDMQTLEGLTQTLADLTKRLADLTRTVADLKERCEEKNNNLMAKKKKLELELVREDGQQRRAMVKLLRQDVQTAMDYLKRQTHASA